MHGTASDLATLSALAANHADPISEILICPPATLIHRAAAALRGSNVTVGGQYCHPAQTGAHTGDLSATMLRDAGARYVIAGHSERRADHGETDAVVRAQAGAAHAETLAAIVCVGEELADRDAGRTLDIIGNQLAGSVPDTSTADNLVIAYEPVWAIGTGQTPTPPQIAEVHGFLRDRLAQRFGTETAQAIRLLYGGSVKPDNAAEIFGIANVDGALVGGASLSADLFSPIISALDAA